MLWTNPNCNCDTLSITALPSINDMVQWNRLICHVLEMHVHRGLNMKITPSPAGTSEATIASAACLWLCRTREMLAFRQFALVHRTDGDVEPTVYCWYRFFMSCVQESSDTSMSYPPSIKPAPSFQTNPLVYV